MFVAGWSGPAPGRLAAATLSAPGWCQVYEHRDFKERIGVRVDH
jgi:hypothetical protein